MQTLWLLVLTMILGSCAMPPKPNSANPATLSINFYSEIKNKKNTKQISALTYWRKLNPDGTKSEPFALGGANAFWRALNTSSFKKAKLERITLDSGVYYLDSFEFIDPSNKNIIISQKGSYTERNGWDDKKNMPLFFSIVLKSGQNLTLPPIQIALKSSDENLDSTDLAQDSKMPDSTPKTIEKEKSQRDRPKKNIIVFYTADCEALEHLHKGDGFKLECKQAKSIESIVESKLDSSANLAKKSDIESNDLDSKMPKSHVANTESNLNQKE